MEYVKILNHLASKYDISDEDYSELDSAIERDIDSSYDAGYRNGEMGYDDDDD